jgi:hypothetical protein
MNMGTIKYNANNEVLQTSLFVTNQSTGPLAMAHFSKVGFQLVWDSLYALSTAVAATGVLTAGAGEITITAVEKGIGGNSILVAMTGEGTAGAEQVLVVGNAIGIAIQSGVTTAAQLVTALQASPEAMALISVAVGTAGVMVAPDSVTLSGGSQGTIDASVSISVSNDSTHWDEITGLAFDIDTSSGNSCVAVEDVFFAYIKLDVAHNSVTDGSLDVSATYKE